MSENLCGEKMPQRLAVAIKRAVRPSLSRVHAKKSPAMAIWLGKQYLGQKDKHEIGGVPGGAPIGLEHSAAGEGKRGQRPAIRIPLTPY